jgi:hypothetical protein
MDEISPEQADNVVISNTSPGDIGNNDVVGDFENSNLLDGKLTLLNKRNS